MIYYLTLQYSWLRALYVQWLQGSKWRIIGTILFGPICFVGIIFIHTHLPDNIGEIFWIVWVVLGGPIFLLMGIAADVAHDHFTNRDEELRKVNKAYEYKKRIKRGF